jgi:hypothetical protein
MKSKWQRNLLKLAQQEILARGPQSCAAEVCGDQEKKFRARSGHLPRWFLH